MRDALRIAAAGLRPDKVRGLLDSQGLAATASAVELPPGLDEGSVVARLAAIEGRFVEAAHPDYPGALVGLPDAPPWLFVRGRLPEGPGVAVVGSRRASAYGIAVAAHIGELVGAAGWPVVSGLATGIDAAAHRGCLDGGGTGVAVLGSGIDVWYPRSNRELGERLLAAGGGVVSEFGPGTPPEPWRFPCRNRIISGLARVVIVVEAATRSGALVTARLALEQGRDVFAVPGDIDRPTSGGTNRLLRDGAYPVVDLDDIVSDLEVLLGPAPRPGPAARQAGRLGELIGTVPAPVEELVAATGWPLSEVVSEIARLEVAGLVSIEDGMVAARPIRRQRGNAP